MKSLFGKILLLLLVGYGLGHQFLLGLSSDAHVYSGDMVSFERAGNYCIRTFNETIQLTAMLKGNPELLSLAGSLDTQHTFVNTLGQILFTASFNEIFTGKVVPSNPILNYRNLTSSLTVWTGAQDNSCNTWTSSDPLAVGDIGDPNDPSSWIFSGNASCGSNIYHILYCVARIGTAQGDPHFVGFNGCKFEFDGQPDTFFAIYSDQDIQVNAFFQQITHISPIVADEDVTLLGKQPDVAPTAASSSSVIGTGNWMTKFGIQLGDQQFVLDPKYGLLHVNTGIVHKTAAQMTLGNNIKVTLQHDGRLVKSAVIEIDRILIRGEVKRFEPDSDTFFINIGFEILTPPVNPHGVLGQTARHIAATPDLPQSPCGIYEGLMENYIVDSILDASFTFSRFHI